MERHECYETFYELYEYVCISLEVIVDRESHPHVYSSLSFTWDRETKTKAQGLLANLKTFGFISTFLITKNSLGTLKPIAAKLQKKDQNVFLAYSMIDDTIKAVVSYFDVGDIVSGKVDPRTLQSHEKMKYLKNHFTPPPSYTGFFSKTVVKGKDKHTKKHVFQFVVGKVYVACI